MTRRRLVVLGTVSTEPYAGMAWMHMQIAAGFQRLGHDVYYLETSSTWPYDPDRLTRVRDSNYAVPYLARVAERFGLSGRWGHRRSYSDKAWLGLSKERAEDLLANADAVFNVTGSCRFAEEGLTVGNPVYFGTDPVYHEIQYHNGHEETRSIIAEHKAAVTYGENIGTPGCPIPPLPGLRTRTRQPVLLDLWEGGAIGPDRFTTVGNWKQDGRDIAFGGELYLWSKHHEFLKFIDLPSRVPVELELATNLADPSTIHHGPEDVVRTLGMEENAYDLLVRYGWKLVPATGFSMDPWPYREYIMSSRGEFTVARDLNVRLQSGWFSERSACYLAAGRPVITQDTGFGRVLPTGEGLFGFRTMDDILAAFEAVRADYPRQSRAARRIAEEYFRAETVLARLLEDLGLPG